LRSKPRPLVVTGTLLTATSMLVFGFWALLSPAGFIDYVNYHPVNEHLAHDAGAFQIGIGTTLVLALLWSDVVMVALAGFAVASGLHTMTHFIDRHLGGHGTDVPLLGLFTVIALVTIYLRRTDKATS